MVAGPTSQAAPPPSSAEYRKIQELASGGMGSVELARAISGPRVGDVVAIKRLHPHLEREKHFADMFFDEAWITAGLNHPNVGAVFDWGTDSNGRYLAMEYVPGDSLLLLIREAKRLENPIPIELALFIIGKTAEGLHAAHELRNEHGQLRHLVHRDVTPSNVMVGIHGEVKLIDFGVAKARDKLSHTSTGTIKGKFGYMSPEQARGFPIDRRSDVFSLGVVLWETLSLKRLYRSESELEILRMIVEDPPQPIRLVRPDVPEPVENLIAGALAKNRDDRLGSCGEFAEFIWAVYHEQGFTAGEAELAAYFRALLPDRYRAIELLLSGAQDFIEPTIARPASGSFSGSNPQQVSGAVMRPAAGPLVTPSPGYPMQRVPSSIGDSQPSLVAASYAAPSSVAAPRRNVPLLAALALGVLLAAGTVGWWANHSSEPASTTSAAPALVPSAAAMSPAVQPSPAEPVPTGVPAPTPVVPAATAVTPTPTPVNATATNSAPSERPSGGHRSHSGHAESHANVTQEDTNRAMLVPASSGNSAGAGHDESQSTGGSQSHANSASSGSGSASGSGNGHPATASSGASGNSGNGGSSGGGSSHSGSSSGSGGSGNSGNSGSSGGIRDLFGHSYGE